jgi:hypothetical protein
MVPRSIARHLRRYLIITRISTIRNAFASAIAPSDGWDIKTVLPRVEEALSKMGQTDLKKLTCVYCNRDAETWDHLVKLVKGGKLNDEGYGHQIGNLAPCCKNCNSAKQGRDFREFVENDSSIEGDRNDLIARLEAHLHSAQLIDKIFLEQRGGDEYKRYQEILDDVRKLFEKADALAEVLRNCRVTGVEMENKEDGARSDSELVVQSAPSISAQPTKNKVWIFQTMKTLFESGHPNQWQENIKNEDYCLENFGLPWPVLSKEREPKERYYADTCDSYYLCNHWTKIARQKFETWARPQPNDGNERA